MSLVVVERSFEQPCKFEELQAQEDEGAWCLEQHSVRFIRTYFSRDKLRMICLYEAPDAESVRTAQRTIDMPVDRVWAADCRDDTDVEANVVVERTFDPPFDIEQLPGTRDETEWCLDMHRVEASHSFVSADGRRVVCTYRAPDVESVRVANRKAELPVDRMWAASVFGPAD
jgi:hypothetical protein